MKSNKKALIVVSSLVILGVGGYFLYTYTKKKKLEKDAKIQADLDAAKSEGQKLAEEAKANAAVEVAKAKGASELEMANTWIKNTAGENAPLMKFSDEYKIAYWKAKTAKAPTFKAEGKTYDTKTLRVYVPEIKDSGAIGKIAYPKKANGLTNVRSSAEVNNGGVNNMLGIVNYPNKIGKIIDMRKGVSGDGKTWYLVELQVGLLKGQGNFVPTAKKGWVREDSIDIKGA